jgi:cullin 2
VKLQYLKKPYFVSMGTFQMAVLLPFETMDRLSVKELQATTQLPEKELHKQALSLVEAKILINDVSTAELLVH